jgi:hypothetical protein
MNKAAAGIVAVLAGVYLVRVGMAKNFPQLLKELAKEGKYLEFIVAIYVLWLLWNIGDRNDFMHQLMIVASVALVFRAMTNMGNVTQTMQAFGAGNIDLFQVFKNIVGGESVTNNNTGQATA